MADPDPNEVRQLLADLRGMNKEKRRTAVMRLGMIGGDQAVRALMEAVQNEHEDLIVRGRSALMLGKLRDQRAVEPLIRALEAPGFQTPLYAAEALGKLGDSRAIRPLLALAAECNDKTYDAAMSALDKLGYLQLNGHDEAAATTVAITSVQIEYFDAALADAEAETELMPGTSRAEANAPTRASDDDETSPRPGRRDDDFGSQNQDYDPVFQP
jgi:HEAT repeat protein